MGYSEMRYSTDRPTLRRVMHLFARHSVPYEKIGRGWEGFFPLATQSRTISTYV